MADNHCDIAIIGAGAAGLTAAIFAGETARQRGAPLRIALLDGARSVGAKILVSGGGRCNVTHDEITLADFNGSKNIVRNVLAAFDEAATVRWFESMNVQLKREETGKLFPETDSARTVLNALLRRCEELGVQLRTEHRVHDIEPSASGFTIRHGRGTLIAKQLILATGGRSLPKTGSDGAGWEIVSRLGHTVTPTYPALVPLVLDARLFHAELSGIAHPAELSTFANGKRIDHRAGSLLWTHFGISGPVAMDASRHWIIAKQTGQAVEMRCNFFPGRTTEHVEQHLVALAASRPRLSLTRLLGEHLPERVAGAILRHLGIDPSIAIGNLPRDPRRRLATALTALPLPVAQDRGWNYAEVTAGGVPLNEIDFRTMQSRKVPGLYLIGEMLDCDGRIGGFNFQWAWSTGHIAGTSAAKSAGPL